MNMSFEDQIRERAYQIWQAGGMADGHADEHWVSAEQAMRGEAATVSVEPEVILTKARPRKASAKPTAKAASAESKAVTKAAKSKASTKSATAPKSSRVKKAAPVAHAH